MSTFQDELALKEYEALQAEKRERMQTRPQIWSLLLGLIGAFGLASIQSGPIGLVIGLYPFLAAAIARTSGHNEAIIAKLKWYLLLFEQTHHYHGYEQYNQAMRHAQSGHHMKALRDALLVTSALASVAVTLRLLMEQQTILAVVVALVELGAMGAMVRWLREKRTALATKAPSDAREDERK